MCDEKQIRATIELAKEQEDYAPKESAKLYLDASKKLIHLANHHPKEQEKYIEFANKLYKKAKKIKKTTSSITYTQIKKTKSNSIITFDDIGGLEDLKDEIKIKIIEPLKDPSLFSYYGKKMGGGILMYGPPGCGKSLIAKATANEANVNFIHVKGSDLKSKYVGETEKNISELFEKARAGPSIIFFDEFEVIGADRSDSSMHDRSAVAQLLTEMDGMDSQNQQILFLAATNEPWRIDSALRREGRFGNTLFIPPPDKVAREEILKLHMQNKPHENINFKLLAKDTKGLSGADLKSICEIATDIPLKESLKTKEKRPINMLDFKKAIKKNSSVMQQWFIGAKRQVEIRKLSETFNELIKYSNQYDSTKVEKELLVN
jgi:transitional endoplasmic reticulum ATPase